MSRMPVIQQRQPASRSWQVQLKKGAVYGSLALGTAAIVIAAIAGNVFAMATISAFTLGNTLILRDRKVTYLFAAALTSVIVGISLAVLFPVAAPFILPIPFILSSGTFTYSLILLSKKIEKECFHHS